MIINTPIKLDNTEIKNRVVLQPMEGCDCSPDGSPSELTRKKYINNAHNGAGIIWFEANAVVPEGRTNPRQMMITEDNLEEFKRLVADVKKTQCSLFGFEPICFIQLTHSGRQSLQPMIAYRNPVYEATRPVTDENIVTDDYLDTLPTAYAKGAKLAFEAGFDGVDVKSCHGYLFQEMLSAFNRPGRYGGSFENRSKLYTDCVEAVFAIKPNTGLVSSRLSITDMVPYPNGFGTTPENAIDLEEPYKLIEEAHKRGINMINITLGNPYYNPHVNRPFKRGGYQAPETPEEGLRRFSDVGCALREKFNDMLFINSGLSFYREDLIDKAERMLADGCADLVGFGRVTLAYPTFYANFLADKFEGKKCCMACSHCTELMRAGQVSGCAVFNPYYRDLYKKTCCKKEEQCKK